MINLVTETKRTKFQMLFVLLGRHPTPFVVWPATLEVLNKVAADVVSFLLKINRYAVKPCCLKLIWYAGKESKKT